jgi:hypothetical protein
MGISGLEHGGKRHVLLPALGGRIKWSGSPATRYQYIHSTADYTNQQMNNIIGLWDY